MARMKYLSRYPPPPSRPKFMPGPRGAATRRLASLIFERFPACENAFSRSVSSVKPPLPSPPSEALPHPLCRASSRRSSRDIKAYVRAARRFLPTLARFPGRRISKDVTYENRFSGRILGLTLTARSPLNKPLLPASEQL